MSKESDRVHELSARTVMFLSELTGKDIILMSDIIAHIAARTMPVLRKYAEYKNEDGVFLTRFLDGIFSLGYTEEMVLAAIQIAKDARRDLTESN